MAADIAEAEEVPLRNVSDLSLDASAPHDDLENVGGNGHSDDIPLPACIGKGIAKVPTEEPECPPESSAEETDFTFREAICTLGFWSISTGAFAIAALGTAMFFHLDDIFSGSQYNEALTRIYLSSALTAGGTTLVTGYLMDWVPAQYVMAVALG